jgi:magnesium-transporting ATPase (P-type)
MVSGQTLYESMVYAGYNFFLGWPIVGVGIFDRDISIPTVLKYPELYISGRLNLDLKTRKMFSWVVMAVVYAVFIYFIPLFTFTRIWHPKWTGTNSTLPGLVEWIDYSTGPDGEESGLYVFDCGHWNNRFVCFFCFCCPMYRPID